MSDEIVAFIKAQLNLDGQLARDAGATRSGKIASWWVDCGCPGKLADEHADNCWDRHVEGDNIVIYDEGGHDEDQARHIARHDPARVLRQTAALRTVVEAYEHLASRDPNEGRDPGNAEDVAHIVHDISARETLLGVLRVFAAIDGDHPDYKRTWNPDGTSG